MKRPSRDTLLVIGLSIVLVAITVAAAVRQSRQAAQPPLASFSSAPDGARALRLFLDESGYTTTSQITDTFSLPDDSGLMFVLEPYPTITDAEWEAIDAWVEAGGALVLAGEDIGTALAIGHYDFTLVYSPLLTLTAPAPLASPPLAGLDGLQTAAFLESERSDYVTLLAAGGQPVAVAFPEGKGQVLLCSLAAPFSNAGLKVSPNPQVMLNLLASALAGSARADGAILFDEWHHGVRPQGSAVIGPEQWLVRTPAGRSVLFAAAVAFLALLLGGRRFGRPLPLRRETARRGPLEYITAIANLNRRAGHRQAALAHYRQRLKRELGRRYRLDAALPDADWVAGLAHLRPDLDAPALLALLNRMRHPDPSERDLVQLTREATGWLKDL